MTVAVYPGSFDPVTLGHLDLVRRGTVLFERLVVAVGRNASKTPLFSPEERVALLRDEVERMGLTSRVTVLHFDGLVVDLCRTLGAGVLLRGVRNFSDFESETTMAATNRIFAPDIETVFALPGEGQGVVSSRLIKEIVAAGGSVERFVPGAVAAALAERLGPAAPDASASD